MLEMPLLKVGGENGDKLLVMLAENDVLRAPQLEHHIGTCSLSVVRKKRRLSGHI